MNKVIIIGSGISGIATSIRLAIKGYNVEVFEANNYPGGKLSAFNLKGYRFDKGPSLFTMPTYVTELFDKAKEDHKEYFNYKKKEVSCNYFWTDRTKFIAYSNESKFINEAEKCFGTPKLNLKNYLKRAKKKYDLTKTLFLENSLHKVKNYLKIETLEALINIGVFDLKETLHSTNKKQFTSKKLIQIFDRFATYNGSNPYKTSGMMTLIQHLEQSYGTFIPEGGMQEISQSLYKLSLRLGVKYNFESKVEKIDLKSKVVKGVYSNSIFYPADIVISNMDIFPTYKKLLKEVPMPKKIEFQESSSSAVIFYWGIKNFFPELDLHNIFFSDDYKNEFDLIFEKNSISEDPTIYINVSSKDVPSDAPEKCENWFVMINTPSDNGQDWSSLVKKLRINIIKKISRLLEVDIEKLIECEEILTPLLIQSQTQSHLGALYGPSSNSKFSAFLRHPNFTSKINNLYFCGGSVHPGGGIPLCLLSAKIVDELIPTAST
jgi:diapolycopene oxygenase